MSPTADHIIPIAKGGHPSDLQNLQLAHLSCNRGKSDKVINKKYIADKSIDNRVLPQSMDWKAYKS
nr:MAG TPA: HNH endonuclease [Caudoviricetes sp.]